MTDSELGKQLEFYSNAIVAFVVLQGLAFCYQFGTDDQFNEMVKTIPTLAAGLDFAFLFVAVGAIWINRRLGRGLASICSERHRELVGTIYGAKNLVLAFFGLIPFLVVLGYAVIPGVGRLAQ